MYNLDNYSCYEDLIRILYHPCQKFNIFFDNFGREYGVEQDRVSNEMLL